jgi:cob(I)alamin adenosyltransferase
MKIYTKTGDKGTTSLIGGKRVAKDHIRIEAYGTVDELIAHVGVVRDHLENKALQDELISVQDQLMICAAVLANDTESNTLKIPKLSEERIVWLEKRIDAMEVKLKPLKNFILPGGHPAVSFAHVARTTCRRAERCIISLTEASEVPDTIIMYFNRLSDYFFVLARFISRELKAKEIHWEPRLDK